MQNHSDKCSNCGSEKSNDYWDYEDGTSLCNECQKKYSKDWKKEVIEIMKSRKDTPTKNKSIQKEKSTTKAPIAPENKCSNCNSSESKKLYKYEDGKLLCEKCEKDALNGLQKEKENKRLVNLIDIFYLFITSGINVNGLAPKKPFDINLINQCLEICKAKGLILTKEYLQDDSGTKTYYKDIKSVKIYLTETRGMVHKDGHVFQLESNHTSFSGGNASYFGFGKKENQRLWASLVILYTHFIEPVIIKKLADSILNDNKKIIIGNVEFDKDGFLHKYFGLVNLKKVLWSEENITLPRLSSIYIENAILVPPLINECRNRVLNSK